MNIFNMKDYLKDIIKSLNNINITITNMDKKINYHINNHLDMENKPLKKEEKIETNDKIKEIEQQNGEYKTKIDELTKDVDFHRNRSVKTWDELKRLRNVVDNLSSEKKELELKLVSLKSDLERVRLDNSVFVEENKKLNEYKEKIKNKELKELEYLKKIKKMICTSEKGEAFWNSISDKVIEKDDLDSREIISKKEPIESNSSYDLTIAGITKTRSQWRSEWDIPKERLRYRIKQKWDNLEILFGRDFKYNDAKRFYIKYPEAILYDSLNEKIKSKLRSELKI